MNGGIINSNTRLDLVGYFYWVILRCTDPWILNLLESWMVTHSMKNIPPLSLKLRMPTLSDKNHLSFLACSVMPQTRARARAHTHTHTHKWPLTGRMNHILLDCLFSLLVTSIYISWHTAASTTEIMKKDLILWTGTFMQFTWDKQIQHLFRLVVKRTYKWMNMGALRTTFRY
jgi:hypothetical protein